MYNCKICDYVCENVASISNHYKYKHSKNDLNDLICDKCDKQCKTLSGLNYHKKTCKGKKEIVICPKCHLEIKTNREKHFNTCNGEGPRRKRPKKDKKDIWNKGLTKDTDERMSKISKSLKEKYKDGNCETPKHTNETKELLSKLMIERYKNGWESVAGRCRKYEYESIIAGKIKVDGRWEYVVAEYFDSLNINWKRNTQRFDYFNEIKNKKSTYCPDFYLIDLDIYIEVKGYKTELDECKWKQFKYKLEIWDKSKMKELNLLSRVNEIKKNKK
ncbi:MAG: Vibrio phage vB VchM Kuja [Bacteroidota bacterium]